MKAPNTKAILQFSISLLRNKITNDISIPPQKQIKQNKQKDFNKGLLELFFKTQDFAKTDNAIVWLAAIVSKDFSILIACEG